jgi:hypothetical protein
MKQGYRYSLLPHSGTISLFFVLSVGLLSAQDAKQDEKKEEKQEKKALEKLAFKEGLAKVDGSIKSDDEKDKAQKVPCKIYTVDLKAKQNYKIDMVSKELDSFLRLESADGKELAKDDDSGGGVNARINFRCPEDATYRVICTTFFGGIGPFTLTISDAPLPKATEITLKEGQATEQGQLTAADGMDAVQTKSPCKIYSIKLAKGKTYQIDMMSKDVDSFLRLENVAGKELAKDDDGGDGHNARIQFECPEDGEYRIMATTFFGGTGIFTLAVKEK